MIVADEFASRGRLNKGRSDLVAEFVLVGDGYGVNLGIGLIELKEGEPIGEGNGGVDTVNEEVKSRLEPIGRQGIWVNTGKGGDGFARQAGFEREDEIPLRSEALYERGRRQADLLGDMSQGEIGGTTPVNRAPGGIENRVISSGARSSGHA